MLALKNSGLKARSIKDRREGVLQAVELQAGAKKEEISLEKLTESIGEILLTQETSDDLAMRSLRQYVSRLRAPEGESEDSPRFLETSSAGQVALARALGHSTDKYVEQDPVVLEGKTFHKHEFVIFVHQLMTRSPVSPGDPRVQLTERLNQAFGPSLPVTVQ